MAQDKLGMAAPINRRQFINGLAVSVGAVASVPWVANPAMAATEISAYPPALTGLRGSHPGSFEAMHNIALGGDSAPEASQISGH